jgi:hypothetical protein
MFRASICPSTGMRSVFRSGVSGMFLGLRGRKENETAEKFTMKILIFFVSSLQNTNLLI